VLTHQKYEEKEIQRYTVTEIVSVIPFSLWGWQSTGTGCPGRLWSLLLWSSRPAWMRSCAACCRWPCFRRGLD